MALTDRHLALLEARGIDGETADRLGVESFQRPGSEDWIRIPYVEGDRIVNWKYRTISGEKKFYQEAGGRKVFWNFNAITDTTLADQPLIVTEGEFDALVAIQCGFARVVSVPDGAPAQQVEGDGAKYSYVNDARAALSSVREIILCTDADGPGINLLNDLAIRLGKSRCKWVRYPKGCKDLNEAFQKYGHKGVTETIARAQWMRVDGVYRMSELPPIHEARPLNIGFPVLDHHYNIRPGDFCVVTGIPSHGKSSFINEVACRMVTGHGWNVAFASFEQKPQIDHRRNLRTWFNGKMVKFQSEAEIRRADEWIDRNFCFVCPSEDDDVTLDWTLERCSAAVIQYNAKLVVVDPFNEMDHVRPPDMTLTEYVGFCIKQFKKFAQKHQVHFILAAHPVKQRKNEDGTMPIPSLYDISDSAHFYNKADVGIIIHRINETKTIIRVAKSRYHDQIGKPGDVECMFDINTCRFIITDTEGARDAA